LAFNGGTPLAITASAVNYTGFGPLVAGVGTNVAFGSGCDQSGFGNRVATGTTVATGGVLTGTLTYSNGGTPGTTNLNGYSINPLGACGAAGETPFAIGADAAGNSFVNFALGFPYGGNVLNNLVGPLDPTLPTAPAIRLDNGGPNPIAGYATGANRIGVAGSQCFGLWVNQAQLDGNGAGCAAPVAGNSVGGLGVISNNLNGQSAFVTGRIARQNGWVNSQVNFGALSSTMMVQQGLTGGDANGAVAPSATVTGTPADIGVGGAVGFVARIGTCTTVATCAALASRTSVNGLADTPNGFALGAIVQTVDLFGNVTNPPTGVAGDNFLLVPNPGDPVNPYVANGVLFVGVDNDVPEIVIGGAAGSTFTTGSIQPAAASNWSISAQDQAPALPAIASGILTTGGGLQIYFSLNRRDGVFSLFNCPTGPVFQSAATACGGVTGWGAGTTVANINASLAVLSDPPGNGLQAYYGMTVFTRDQAGNQSAVTNRDFIFDNVIPTVTGNSFSPAAMPTNGGPITFSGSLQDALDVARGVHTIQFPSLAALVPVAPATAAPQFIRLAWENRSGGAANPIGYNFPGPSTLGAITTSAGWPSIRSIELVGAGGAIPVAATNAGSAPTNFEYLGMDVARNASAIQTTAIGFGQTGLPAGLAFWSNAAAAAPFTGMTWNMATVLPSGVTGVDVNGSGTNSARPASIVVSATAFSPTLAWNSPFLGGVKFYVVDSRQNAALGAGTGQALVEICTAGTPLQDQATNTWTYSCTYTPNTLLQAHDFLGFNFANSANLHGAAGNNGFQTNGLASGPALAAGAVQIIAIGFNTAGQGLATLQQGITHQP
jgi:hypothetical protein